MNDDSLLDGLARNEISAELAFLDLAAKERPKYVRIIKISDLTYGTEIKTLIQDSLLIQQKSKRSLSSQSSLPSKGKIANLYNEFHLSLWASIRDLEASWEIFWLWKLFRFRFPYRRKWSHCLKQHCNGGPMGLRMFFLLMADQWCRINDLDA